jgi:hypothetical protein
MCCTCPLAVSLSYARINGPMTLRQSVRKEIRVEPMVLIDTLEVTPKLTPKWNTPGAIHSISFALQPHKQEADKRTERTFKSALFRCLSAKHALEHRGHDKSSSKECQVSLSGSHILALWNSTLFLIVK